MVHRAEHQKDRARHDSRADHRASADRDDRGTVVDHQRAWRALVHAARRQRRGADYDRRRCQHLRSYHD
ncbi:hypothetical protein SE17_10090 [Kouleothrix aurantiaca]|uniref:Uncharacterized protein n=1 Tax=Kouleothrix aurantiaca TaxID=186479 RepID=A0A0P9DT55_9CHLR|nr:hypothetical protein SE17_10090 [Kouleothrix aurantiaca]